MRVGLLAVALWLPLFGYAQTTPEIFGTVSFNHSLEKGGEPHVRGVGLSGGLGFTNELSRMGLEVEFTRLFDRSTKRLTCQDFGVSPPTCEGSGRYGPESLSLVSGNLHYQFPGSSVQPYVTGGAGGVWSKVFRAYYSGFRYAGQRISWVQEVRLNQRGFVWNLGGGVRIPISRSASLRPDIRFYNTSLRHTSLSGPTLNFMRISIAVGIHW